MSILNQVLLIGNIVRDFEVRTTSSGAEVTNLEIIVDNPVTQDKKTFVSITAWDKLALLMSKSLQKGSKVLIQGRLTTDPPKNGDRGSLIVTATGFTDLTSR